MAQRRKPEPEAVAPRHNKRNGFGTNMRIAAPDNITNVTQYPYPKNPTNDWFTPGGVYVGGGTGDNPTPLSIWCGYAPGSYAPGVQEYDTFPATWSAPSSMWVDLVGFKLPLGGTVLNIDLGFTSFTPNLQATSDNYSYLVRTYEIGSYGPTISIDVQTGSPDTPSLYIAPMIPQEFRTTGGEIVLPRGVGGAVRQ